MAFHVSHVAYDDLEELLGLYSVLHPDDKIEDRLRAESIWEKILDDADYNILVGKVEGVMVASLTLVVIDNLTRRQSPYGIVENVITLPEHRNNGYASVLMKRALDIAQERGCYKVMLSTSSKKASVHNFYQKCGFNKEDKTAFIKWIQAI